MKGLVSFTVGLLFAFGLGYSGMTQTHVVKGFLDVFGNWDMKLVGVMTGGIIVHSVVYQILKKRKSPILDSKFYLPTKIDIDKKLIAGAAIFGLGWGWAGICPGPGIVSLVSGDLSMITFIVAMVAGMYVFKFFEKKYL